MSWLWIPLALGSALFAALVAIFGKLGLGRVDTVTSTTVRAAVMFALLLVLALATGSIHKFNALQGREALFVVLAGAAGAASWLLYFYALKIGKASQIASVDRLSIVFAIVLAALFLGEKIGWKTGLGAALMTLGALLISLA